MNTNKFIARPMVLLYVVITFGNKGQKGQSRCTLSCNKVVIQYYDENTHNIMQALIM